MNIIVTGASGFLGRELVSQLGESNKYTVVALTSNKNELEKYFSENANVVVFDREGLFKQNIKIEKKDVLINCAFPRSADQDLAEGMEYVKSVLEVAVQNRIGAVINISSQSVYSSKRKKPANEEEKVQLNSMYAVGKYATELLTQSICREIPYTNIRLASLIGPGFDQRVTNKLVDIALDKKNLSIKIGKQYWGFLDVEDAARGISSLLNIPLNKWRKIYNLGSNSAYTLLEVAQVIKKVLKETYDIEISINTEVAESEQSSALDSTAIEQDTGYVPTIILEESIRRIISKKIDQLLIR